MLDLQTAFAVASDLVSTGRRHPDYQRTVDLARKYRAMMTGEDLDYLMRQFNRRESEEDFKQRLRLTKHITPAICSTLMNPAHKMVGVKPIIDTIDYGKENDGAAKEIR